MGRKLAVEAIGTFFLVFTIGMCVLEPAAGPIGVFAIAGVLIAMIYAGGHISGAHYNPAVTLAAFIRGACNIHEAIGYWVMQLVSGAVAAMVVLWVKGGGPLTVLTLDAPRVLAVEFVFTFALAYVVLNVATARGVEGNSYFGGAIGLTVLAGAYAVGAIAGAGAFNPAVSLGIVVFGVIAATDIWMFLVAQLAAGALAGVLFNALDLGNDKPTTATPAEQASLTPQATPAP
jgi:aquaporin Z